MRYGTINERSEKWQALYDSTTDNPYRVMTIPGQSSHSKSGMRIGVKKKVFFAFLSLAVIIFTVTGGVAFLMMGDMGTYSIQTITALSKTATQDSAGALENEAEMYLIRLATDQADISNIIFSRIISDMEVITAHAEVLIQPDASYSPLLIYDRYLEPATMRTAPVTHFAPGTNLKAVSEECAAMNALQQTSIPLYLSNHQLTSVYVASESGILSFYPWTSSIEPSFDPRTRDWFTQAINNTGIIWSQPYVDLLGNGLMVTCSQAVRDKESGRTWVIATDVTLETINKNIISTQLGDRSYAFILDSDGNIVTRPGITSSQVNWDESYQTDNFFESDNAQLVAIAQNMTRGFSGINRCIYNEGEKFIAYAPIRDVGWSVGLAVPVDTIMAPTRILIKQISQTTVQTQDHIDQQNALFKVILLGVFFSLFILVTGLAILFARRITEPVFILKKGTSAIGDGNLQYKVDIRTNDEFEDLAGDFNQMAQNLRSHIDELKRTTAEKERLHKELEIAQDIQKSFLPDSIPDISGFDIAAYSLPALEVGGDFYDFIPLDNSLWGLVIADVSGKGIPAALFMALSRTLIRVSTALTLSPADAIREANNLIFQDSKTSMFVTLFYAILDADAMTLTYVNAGHNPPVMITKEKDSTVNLLKADGIALGVLDDIELETVTINLDAGDTIVLYTDGVNEAMNAEGEEYGMKRFTTLINDLKEKNAETLIHKITDAIVTFAGGYPQSDDITLVVIHVPDER